MVNILKHKVLLGVGAIFALGVLYYVFFGETQPPAYDTALVARGDVVQEVSVTGNVKPKEAVDLAFEISGRVANVYVSVGSKVKKGDMLASLDSSDIDAKFAQALAGVDAAKATLKQYNAAYSAEDAKLTEIKKGTRPEEVQLSETKVANAKKSLSDAETNLSNIKEKADNDLQNLYDDVDDILNEAYTKADDATSKQIVDIISEGSSNDFQLTFGTYDSILESKVENERITVKSELISFKQELASLDGSYSSLDSSLDKAAAHLVVIRNFLSDLDDVVDVASGLSSATKSTYKGYISTGRNNVNTEISDINAQKQNIAAQKITNQNNIFSAEAKVNDAKSALAAAEDELNLKKAGSTKEQIDAQEQRVVQAEANIGQQEAVVKQQEANVNSLKAQILKTIIYSPIEGTVTKQDAKVGQIVSVNSPLISVISEGEFEIEVNIPEADIAKVKIGNTARVTLDAYGDSELFEAEVIKIDPAETVIEGVSTYKTTLSFKKESERIRSGMTANIDILTGKKENVIAIPQRAVAEKNGDKIVRVIKNGKPEDVKIETGLRGSDGRVEVTRGLSEGDTIIVFER